MKKKGNVTKNIHNSIDGFEKNLIILLGRLFYSGLRRETVLRIYNQRMHGKELVEILEELPLEQQELIDELLEYLGEIIPAEIPEGYYRSQLYDQLVMIVTQEFGELVLSHFNRALVTDCMELLRVKIIDCIDEMLYQYELAS